MTAPRHRPHPARHRAATAPPARRVRIGAVGLALGLAAGLGVAVGGGDADAPVHPAEPVPAPAVSQPATARWERVLIRLDRRRERAFEVGRAGLLSRVYEAGSAALRRDRAVLRAYARRELTVTRARTEWLDVDLRRRAGRLTVLRVVDRLGAAGARTRSGRLVPLPRDRPTTHRIVLRRGADGWLLADVRALSG